MLIQAGADTIEHASFIDDEGIRLAIENDAALSMDIYVTGTFLRRDAGILEESLKKAKGATQRANFRKAVEEAQQLVWHGRRVYPHGQNANARA